ncbi:MAG: DoxX family membrane protein [Bacteroidota bacterium]
MNAFFTMINRLRRFRFFKLTYWGVRIGLALAFILSGIRKLPGVKFTILPKEDPVGAFFHVMHESGFYWNFIGYFQIGIGLLLFVNRYLPLLYLLMMPVTVNIFLVSVSLNMRGTPIITSLMLLGNIFLMLWHYEHYLQVLNRPDPQRLRLNRE